MIRSHKKTWIIGMVLVMFIAGASFAFREAPTPAPPPEQKGPQNLKVLPKNIDHMALIKIMHDFCDALNFKCNNCHAPAASPTKPGDLDFASDAKPEKETARNMMRMVMRINKKFFKVKGGFADNFVNAKYEITCYTCHHGDEHPDKDAPPRKHEMGMGAHPN